MDEVAAITKFTISCSGKFITDSCLPSCLSLTVASIVLRNVSSIVLRSVAYIVLRSIALLFVDEVASVAKFTISSLGEFTANSSFLSCSNPLDTIISN